MFIGFAVAGYFGPSIMTKMAKMTPKAFIIGIGLSAIALVLTFVFKAFDKKEL